MPVRVFVGMGFAAIATCVTLVGLLHRLAVGEVDPIRRTISEYALGGFGWMFVVGVIGLAVGSALVLAALVGAGLLRWPSGAAFSLATWTATLLVLVVFEKANWSVGPSTSGYIHRYAGLVAFIALPAAALSIGRSWRGDPHHGRLAAWTRGLGLLSFGWLSMIVFGMLLYPLTGVSLWPLLPLGLLERGLALTDVAAVVVLGCWAWRAAGESVAPAHRAVRRWPGAVPARP